MPKLETKCYFSTYSYIVGSVYDFIARFVYSSCIYAARTTEYTCHESCKAPAVHINGELTIVKVAIMHAVVKPSVYIYRRPAWSCPEIGILGRPANTSRSII